MNEITLSNNLAQIELEINHHKQIAGQSIWEIGRRLNHVKENDLAHGQFMEWVEKQGISHSEALRMMKVSKELPNSPTLANLGTTALHLLATLPDEQKEEQLNRIEQGESPTVRELQEVKRQLQLQKQITDDLTDENSRLKSATVEVREVVREIVPADYNEALARSEKLTERTKAAEERNAFLEEQLKQVAEQREKAGQLDDIERAIEQNKGYLTEQQKEVASTKETVAFLKKGNQFLANFGGVSYLDIQAVLPKNAQLRMELETFASQLGILLDDVNIALEQSKNEILEGEII